MTSLGGKADRAGVAHRDALDAVVEGCPPVPSAGELASILLAELPDVIMVVDRDLTLTYTNEYTAELLGYDDPRQLVGRPAADFFRYPEELFRGQRLTLAAGLKEYRTVLITAAGRDLPVSWNARPLYVAGRLAGAWGVARDLRETERLQGELGTRNSLLESLLDASRTLSRPTERHEVHAHAWAAASRIFGADRGSLWLPQQPGQLEPAGWWGAGTEPAGLSVGLGEVSAFTLAYEYGDTHLLSDAAVSRLVPAGIAAALGVASAVFIGLKANAPLGVLVVGFKAPRQFGELDSAMGRFLGNEVAHALVRAGQFAAERAVAERLRELDRMKEDFTALISHELRAPLQLVSSSARRLAEHPEVIPKADRCTLLRVIADEARRLSSLVDDLRDLTQIRQGMLRCRFVRTSLRQVVESAVAEARMAYTGVRVALDADRALDAPLLLDPQRIRQVLLNLLTNAERHSPPDGTITVRVHTTSTGVEVRVEDEGPGIPADQRLAIRAWRVKGEERPGGGLGIGLFVCDALVDAHGGTLEIGDAPHGGAAVTVRLPGYGQRSQARP